eukprot:SAG31_NODE_2196_length_6219_cov_1.796569_6_plen_56_part_00
MEDLGLPPPSPDPPPRPTNRMPVPPAHQVVQKAARHNRVPGGSRAALREVVVEHA